MLNITSTQLKQQAHILDRVKDEEIAVTKRNKPFAVIVSIERYNELIKENKEVKINKKLDALNTLGSFKLGGKSFAELKAEMVK